jgi:hypothetical protein
MDFDFYKQYKSYSNTELLKIVRRPVQYQAAAISAATKILAERQITAEELRFVDQYLKGIDVAAIAKQEKISALKDKSTDFFESVLNPGEKVDPKKWVNILLLALGIQYAWALYGTVRLLIYSFLFDRWHWDIDTLLAYSNLLYVPLAFYLLLKRKRWGWILLFADSLFSLIARISQTHIFFKYQSLFGVDVFYYFLGRVIEAAFVYFLLRKQIADYFEITRTIKRKTVLIVTCGSLLFNLIMFLTN